MSIDFGRESWPDKMVYGLVLSDYSELQICLHVTQYSLSAEHFTENTSTHTRQHNANTPTMDVLMQHRHPMQLEQIHTVHKKKRNDSSANGCKTHEPQQHTYTHAHTLSLCYLTVTLSHPVLVQCLALTAEF